MLFQYHEQVGYIIAYGRDDDQTVQSRSINTLKLESKDDSTNGLINKINMLIQDGDDDSTINTLQQSTRGIISDPVIAEYHFSLLQLCQMIPEIMAFATIFLKMIHLIFLLKTKRYMKKTII